MDSAIDTMKPLGSPNNLFVKIVKELLEVSSFFWYTLEVLELCFLLRKQACKNRVIFCEFVLVSGV